MASTLVRPGAFSICASMPIGADVEAGGLLDLGQQQVERDDLLGGLHLGQHDRSRGGRRRPRRPRRRRGRSTASSRSLTRTARTVSPQPPSLARRRCSCGPRAWPGARRRPRGRGRPGRRAGPWPCRSSWCSTPAPPGSSVGAGACGRRAGWSWPEATDARRGPSPCTAGDLGHAVPPAPRASRARPGGGRTRLAGVSEESATPSAAPAATPTPAVAAPPAPDPQAALLAEAATKSGLLWVDVPGDRAWPAWHVWVDGAAYVVSGPGEQALPELPESVVLVLRSKDTGGRLLTGCRPRASRSDPRTRGGARRPRP